jgi:hypothetical protein
MAKKEETKKEEKKPTKNDFDLDKALKECPKPEWYKNAFVKVMDTSKIKNQNDLTKQMKEFGAMK